MCVMWLCTTSLRSSTSVFLCLFPYLSILSFKGKVFEFSLCLILIALIACPCMHIPRRGMKNSRNAGNSGLPQCAKSSRCFRRNWLSKNCIFWQPWNLSGCCQAFQMKKLSQSLMLPGSQCSNTCLLELKLYIQVFLPFHTVAKYGKMKVIDDDHSGAVLLPFLNTRITLHRSASWWCNGCSHELSVSLQMAFGIRRDHWPDFLGQVSVQEFLQALESGRLTEPRTT